MLRTSPGLQNRVEQGLPTPSFDNIPDFPEGLEWILDAFGELSTSRPVGMGAGPIPFTAIAEYARWYEIADFDEFLTYIRALDTAYLDHAHADTATKRES